ncbi:MAG: hypothetical protein ACQEXJ_05415 [Myxococcota bacterium]
MARSPAMTRDGSGAMRIRFIVTGDVERAALVPSIKRLFTLVAPETEPEWLPPQKVPATTTSRLRHSTPPSAPMRRLAKAMIMEASEGEDGTPADLVVAVDDLELANFDQPDVVCEHLRQAIDDEIGERQLSMRAEQRLRDRLKERCSFHLLAPMVEAYFFGEHDALVRAGCAPSVQPHLRNANDVESFFSTDTDWLPVCQARNQHQAAAGFPWWEEERHAKHYLEYLVDREGGDYDEMVGGRRALEDLDWQAVGQATGSVALVRAMMEDIADTFAPPLPNPIGAGTPSRVTYPSRQVRRRDLRLRNL